ncbi:MAG TPA: Crp/Fnr family transcriptional regulator [Burkholderiaceae bacterium]|nr:Crp/Fnr family transcriptional regulator [Burkholderiaceae bacterium]
MDPRHNQLLAALPDLDWARWHPHLQSTTLDYGQVLFESGSVPTAIVFPTSAVISLSSMTRDGASAEVAVVGNEGVVGISLFMGGGTMPHRALVQSAGQGWRLPAAQVHDAVAQGSAMLRLLLRYTQSLIVQTTQTAACNRHHSIAQQLSRRLLMALDRVQSDELAMTQEAAANLLGVRREGVTAAALKLQRAGTIRYHRGRISVLDRAALEQHACECYGVAKREYQRLVPLALAA